MTAASLTPLLARAREAGLRLSVEGPDLVVVPRSRLSPELRGELLAHKTELLPLLEWRESVAHALLKDAMAYLAEFHDVAADLAELDAFEDAIDAAMEASDMHALRVAVRGWVEAGVEMFRARAGDRGTAA